MFKPNATKNILAEYCRDQINALNNSDKVHVQPYILKYKLPSGKLGSLMFWVKENAVGRMLLSLYLMDTTSTYKDIYRTEKRVSDLKNKLMLKQQQMK